MNIPLLRKYSPQTTWRKLITDCAGLDVIRHCTLTEEELNIPFDPGYGTTYGKPFTAWSDKFVYFPVAYDGSEWVERVLRNPSNIPTQHVGGQ